MVANGTTIKLPKLKTLALQILSNRPKAVSRVTSFLCPAMPHVMWILWWPPYTFQAHFPHHVSTAGSCLFEMLSLPFKDLRSKLLSLGSKAPTAGCQPALPGMLAGFSSWDSQPGACLP